MEKKPQCFTCKHNIKQTSCGSCVEKGSEMIQSIAQELELSSSELEENPGDSYKHSCKVLLNNPEEFNSVDPYKCRFYLPKFFKF